MNKRLQEFFWTPTETVRGLRDVVPELDLWVALWALGQDAQSIDVNLLSDEVLQDKVEDSVHLFLGSLKLNPGPVWRGTAGKHLLDMQRSCAVQLVPPVVSDRALLQGRLAMLRSDQYDNLDCIARLPTIFRRLRESMRIYSDRRRVIKKLFS
jgi:hypothetical protein